MGDDGHPAGEVVAEIHAPYLPQPPTPPIVDRQGHFPKSPSSLRTPSVVSGQPILVY
jgi:hypothetical protein